MHLPRLDPAAADHEDDPQRHAVPVDDHNVRWTVLSTAKMRVSRHNRTLEPLCPMGVHMVGYGSIRGYEHVRPPIGPRKATLAGHSRRPRSGVGCRLRW
jgi:hypothetical protein